VSVASTIEHQRGVSQRDPADVLESVLLEGQTPKDFLNRNLCQKTGFTEDVLMAQMKALRARYGIEEPDRRGLVKMLGKIYSRHDKPANETLFSGLLVSTTAGSNMDKRGTLTDAQKRLQGIILGAKTSKELCIDGLANTLDCDYNLVCDYLSKLRRHYGIEQLGYAGHCELIRTIWKEGYRSIDELMLTRMKFHGKQMDATTAENLVLLAVKDGTLLGHNFMTEGLGLALLQAERLMAAFRKKYDIVGRGDELLATLAQALQAKGSATPGTDVTSSPDGTAPSTALSRGNGNVVQRGPLTGTQKKLWQAILKASTSEDLGTERLMGAINCTSGQVYYHLSDLRKYYGIKQLGYAGHCALIRAIWEEGYRPIDELMLSKVKYHSKQMDVTGRGDQLPEDSAQASQAKGSATLGTDATSAPDGSGMPSGAEDHRKGNGHNDHPITPFRSRSEMPQNASAQPADVSSGNGKGNGHNGHPITPTEGTSLQSRESLGEFDFGCFVGKSPPMLAIYETLKQVAPTNATVLLTGETGTGKEMAARSIHMLSSRVGKPFIPVNCGSLPEDIQKSELFGHEKGAFTGAHTKTGGYFGEANGGTIFLDEIGNMSPSAQAELLRVLQGRDAGNREITRVGSAIPIKINVRVIAATNKDLEKKIKNGSFHEDLFYRLNVVNVEMPPLRDRRGDIPLLVDHFLSECATIHNRPVPSVEEKVMKTLMGRPWKGNARELWNACERMVILCRTGQIDIREYSRLFPDKPATRNSQADMEAGGG